MFQTLHEKPKILVTGPMRSGTTICAEMIAHDIGREVLREEDAVRWPAGEWPAKYVVQAPYLATQLLQMPTEWFVVSMHRSMEEMTKSAKKFFDEMFPTMGVSTEGIREQLHWMQKAIDHFENLYPERILKVQYDELRSHPFWVEDRSNFTLRQTRF